VTVAVVALVLALVSLAALGVAYISLRELGAEIDGLRQDLAARGRDEELIELCSTIDDFERREQKIVDQITASFDVHIDLDDS